MYRGKLKPTGGSIIWLETDLTAKMMANVFTIYTPPPPPPPPQERKEKKREDFTAKLMVQKYQLFCSETDLKMKTGEKKKKDLLFRPKTDLTAKQIA